MTTQEAIEKVKAVYPKAYEGRFYRYAADMRDGRKAQWIVSPGLAVNETPLGEGRTRKDAWDSAAERVANVALKENLP